MFGNATLEIPASGIIGPTQVDGLSDELAMTIGRVVARTLSEYDEPVTVLLENGKMAVIGRERPDGTIIRTITVG